MITQTGAKLILDYFRGESRIFPEIYIGLSSTDPTVTGEGVTEPSAASYARVHTSNENPDNGNFFAPAVNEPDGASITNDDRVVFNETYNPDTDTAEDWGELRYVCLFGSATGTDLYAYQLLNAPIHPGAGGETSIATIRPGDITIKLCNP